MAVDPPDGSLKFDEVNKIASEACTRAGAFALLVSVLLFVLCASLQDRKADEALAGYVASRLNLAMFVEELQKNQIWQNYAASHPDADQKPLAQLVRATVEIRPPHRRTLDFKNQMRRRPARESSRIPQILLETYRCHR
jgi:hypothetical protein